MKLIIYILFPIYMSKELNDFKQMRITALNKQYTIDLNSLNLHLQFEHSPNRSFLDMILIFCRVNLDPIKAF